MRYFIVILFSIVISQNIQDARMLGLSGAYSTLSNGYRAVGVNPANINNGTSWTVNIFSSKTSFLNNLFTLDRYNEINGAHFDNTLTASYYDKEKILDVLDGDGLQLSFSSINSIPSLNFSKDNYAFTSNVVFYGDVEFPEAFVDMMFFGNQVEYDTLNQVFIPNELNMSFKQNMLITVETGFTYCKNFEEANLGVTLKYLQGLYYSNREDLAQPYFKTDITSYSGYGNYLIKQGLGGNGFAFDIGFSTKEFDNGMTFGASLINAFSSMEWNKDSQLRKGLEGAGLSFPVREKEYFFFTFGIDPLNAETLMNSTTEDLFQTETYKVCLIDFSDIPQVSSSATDFPPFYINSDNFINNNDSTVLSPNEDIVDASKIVILDDGRVVIPTENLDNLSDFSSAPFKMDYPTYLRFGVSKNFKSEKILFAADIMTGFDNMFGNEDRWKLSLGVEFNKYPKTPIRAGVTLGGKDETRFGLGTGYSFGSMKIDIAYGFIDGFSLYDTRGMDLALNMFYDYKEPEEGKLTFIDKISNFFKDLIKRTKERFQK